MADSDKKEKFYLTLGKVTWFILRWLFYGVLFYIAFMMGGKQGTLKERARQVQFPKITIEVPKNTTTASVSSPPSTSSYVILVGSYPSPAAAEGMQEMLRAARINNYIIQANGMYHVCVGEYRSASKANRVLKQVQQQGFPSATIVAPSVLAGTL